MENFGSGLLTVKEFCAVTGASRATVWRWQKSGVIKGVRVGGHLFYTENDVQAFRARHTTSNGSQAGSLNERVVCALEVISCAQVARRGGQAEVGTQLEIAAAELLKPLGLKLDTHRELSQ